MAKKYWILPSLWLGKKDTVLQTHITTLYGESCHNGPWH